MLITGAGRGLGREYAGFFAADGHPVVCADIDHESAVAAAEEIARSGGRTVGVHLDVTDEASATAAVAEAASVFGSVDILINNAGIWGDYEQQGCLGQDLAKWRRSIDVMLTGPFICAKAVVPGMSERGWGRIVNISSIGAYMPGSGAYGVAKLGLNQLSHQIAAEVGDAGITCNVVAPGSIRNEATQRQVPDEFLNQLVAMNAIKRFGTGRDMYGAIRFLCSDDADWVTGQVLSPNGGSHARY